MKKEKKHPENLKVERNYWRQTIIDMVSQEIHEKENWNPLHLQPFFFYVLMRVLGNKEYSEFVFSNDRHYDIRNIVTP